MIGEYEEIQKIKEYLIENSKGMSITEISKQLNLHRTTTAKYLDILQMKGDIDLRIMGTSKLYQPSERIPAAVIRRFHSGPYLLLTSRLTVKDYSDDFEELMDVREKIIGRDISDQSLLSLMSGDMPALCKEAVYGKASSVDISIAIRKTIKNLTVRIMPIVYDDGRAGSSLLITDRSEIFQIKKEAQICDDEVKGLTDDLSEFMFSCLPDGIVLRVNSAFCTRMNRREDELIGFPYEPVISHEDTERLSKLKESITPDTPVQAIKFKAIQPDGMVAWEEWSYRGIFDKDTSLERYLAVGRDISRIHHLEEQLETFHTNFEELVKQRTREMRKANQDLMSEIARREKIERELLIIEAAFDHASDSILLFERSGRLWRANETSCRLLGYTKEDIVDITVFSLNKEITPDIWDIMWQKADEKPEIWRLQAFHQKKDGSIIRVDVSRTFIKAGPITLFCSIARETGQESGGT